MVCYNPHLTGYNPLDPKQPRFFFYFAHLFLKKDVINTLKGTGVYSTFGKPENHRFKSAGNISYPKDPWDVIFGAKKTTCLEAPFFLCH